MKECILAACLLLLVGCSSPPKDVGEAWRKYRDVKKGMTRHEVHALVGVPRLAQNSYEEWLVGQPFQQGACSACLSVTYGADGRVSDLDKWLSRRPDTKTEGLAY